MAPYPRTGAAVRPQELVQHESRFHQFPWLDRFHPAARHDRRHRRRARRLEVHGHRRRQRRLRQPARADGVGDGRRRPGARAPPDHHVHRHRAGTALDHPAQRAGRHRAPGSADPGQIVEAGTVLVALDVSVEEAELRAQEAQAALAETTLAAPGESAANTAPPRRKRWTGRAPSATSRWRRSRGPGRSSPRRSSARRSGPGSASPTCTPASTWTRAPSSRRCRASTTPRTWTSPSPSGSRRGCGWATSVGVTAGNDSSAVPARIVAVDARVDPTTRNAMVRATIVGGTRAVARRLGARPGPRRAAE